MGMRFSDFSMWFRRIGIRVSPRTERKTAKSDPSRARIEGRQDWGARTGDSQERKNQRKAPPMMMYGGVNFRRDRPVAWPRHRGLASGIENVWFPRDFPGTGSIEVSPYLIIRIRIRIILSG
jgi:hypothetical protein